MSIPQKRLDFSDVYEKYFDTVYRVAFIHIKKPDDSADVVQDVFFKYLICQKNFENDEHKKAWLLTCAYNATMDYFRSKWRKNVELKELGSALPFEIDETLEILLSLPEKYKAPIYMYYYEGYSTDEIAKILHKPASTVRVNLKRGREQLKKKLGKEGGNN